MYLWSTFSWLFLFCAQIGHIKEPRKHDRIVEEYLISYKNGISQDTVLRSRSFYDVKGNLIKELSFYNNKNIQTIIYLNKDAVDFKKVSTKSDNIVYAVKSPGRQTRFYNGKVKDDIYYDRKNNIIKDINYNIDAGRRVPVVEEYTYAFDKAGKKVLETFRWNKDTIYEVKYIYSKDSLLIEKDFLRNKCCEGNQPIPMDKILYEYGKNRNLIKEIEVIDRNVKRPYKEQFDGYLNQITTITYKYDDQNRLIDKKKYAPVMDENPNSKIDDLYKRSSTLAEEYLYKYY